MISVSASAIFDALCKRMGKLRPPAQPAEKPRSTPTDRRHGNSLSQVRSPCFACFHLCITFVIWAEHFSAAKNTLMFVHVVQRLPRLHLYVRIKACTSCLGTYEAAVCSSQFEALAKRRQ